MEVLCVNYITTNEVTKIWIKGSKKMGNTWLVPVDKRFRSSKVKDGENK